MRFSSREIEALHVNPVPDGDAWRCPYCDEAKWGETTWHFNGKPVCSALCLDTLIMVDEYEGDIDQAARDLDAARFWNSLGWTLCFVVLMLLIISIGGQANDWHSRIPETLR